MSSAFHRGRKEAIEVTVRERDVILAALRLWQTAVVENLPSDILLIAENNGERLSDEAIDALCERINKGE